MAGAHVWAAKIAAAVVVLAAAGCRADEPRFGGPESDTRHRRQRSDVRDAEVVAQLASPQSWALLATCVLPGGHKSFTDPLPLLSPLIVHSPTVISNKAFLLPLNT